VIFVVLVLLSLRRGRSREDVAQMRLARAAEVAWLIGVGFVWLTINLLSIPWIP
jgi:hypothetical protein